MKKMMLAVLILCGEYLASAIMWIIAIVCCLVSVIVLIAYFIAPVIIGYIWWIFFETEPKPKNGEFFLFTFMLQLLWIPAACFLGDALSDLSKVLWKNFQNTWAESQKKAEEYISRKERAQGGDLTIADKDEDDYYGQTHL